MEFPTPTIDFEAEFQKLFDHPDDVRRALQIESFARFRQLLAQAWEEGRWSPPGACMNPYGSPAETVATGPVATLPGTPLQRLRAAAQAALAWVENMAPTVRRTALANQLRAALGGK